MRGRAGVVAAAVAALLLLPGAVAPAATNRATESETLVLTAQDTRPVRSRYAYTAKTPITVIISGTLHAENGGYKGTHDALFCVSCADHRLESHIDLKTKQSRNLIPSSAGGLWTYHFRKDP